MTTDNERAELEHRRAEVQGDDFHTAMSVKPEGMPRVNCKRTGEHPAHIHESRLPNRTARFWCEPGGSRP